MKTSLHLLIALLASLSSSLRAELPRSSPEAQGVSSSAILAFVEAADQGIDSLHSVMLVRHGQVIAEGWWSPYNAGSPHVLFSLSKSFASTAAGLAVAEGKLRVDDEVLKFFPEAAPAEPGDNLKAMRVRDLLRMNTGHETEPPRPPDQSWKQAFLSHPVRFKPGTHFLYNTSATYMLAAIVEKVTGQSLLEYLRPRLFEPLGIENPTWEKSPEGITLGGYGLSIRTEDIARFGQLYLREGKWQGKQLIPEAWVRDATSFQTSNGSNPKSDWDQGYGYQFWRCRHACYRGDGAFGQYCIVLPQQDAVLAITGGLRDMQAVLNLVWEKLLPAMASSPLPSNEPAREKLTQALKGLTMRPEEGSATPPKVFGRKYQFAANARGLEAITLEHPEAGSTTIVLQINGAETRVVCGEKAWQKGRVAWGSDKAQAVAASGAWTTEDTFTARFCLYETPFVHTVRLKFSGDEVRFASEANVGFGPTKEPELVGKAAAARAEANFSGLWRAEFDTQIGPQKYVFDLKSDGEKVTGKARSDIGGEQRETELAEGRLVGDVVRFVENLDFQGNALRIVYTGKLVADGIQFTREVGEVAKEEFTATRVTTGVAPNAAAAKPASEPDRRGFPRIELGPDDKAAFPAAPAGFDVRRDGIARGKIETVAYDSKVVGISRQMVV